MCVRDRLIVASCKSSFTCKIQTGRAHVMVNTDPSEYEAG